jgi:hypothetical protein
MHPSHGELLQRGQAGWQPGSKARRGGRSGNPAPPLLSSDLRAVSLPTWSGQPTPLYLLPHNTFTFTTAALRPACRPTLAHPGAPWGCPKHLTPLIPRQSLETNSSLADLRPSVALCNHAQGPPAGTSLPIPALAPLHTTRRHQATPGSDGPAKAVATPLSSIPGHHHRQRVR